MNINHLKEEGFIDISDRMDKITGGRALNIGCSVTNHGCGKEKGIQATLVASFSLPTSFSAEDLS